MLAILFIFRYEMSAQTCPATLEVRHVPAETKGWTAAAVVKTSRLSSARVLRVRGESPYSAIDSDEARGRDGSLTLKWDLEGLKSAKFQLECVYEHTHATLSQDLAATVKSCTLKGKLDGKGKILSAPPTVTCQ